MLLDLIGLVGVGLIIGAYFLGTKQKWNFYSVKYFGTHTAGNLLILSTLLKDFNLAAFTATILFLCISVYGLVKCLRETR